MFQQFCSSPQNILFPWVTGNNYLLFPLHTEFIDLNQQPCVLRPQIYFLGQPAPHENAFMWPYAVKLPRCAGSCSIRKDVLECRPSNKVQIPLVTYRVPYHSSRKRRDVMEEFARMEGMFF